MLSLHRSCRDQITRRWRLPASSPRPSQCRAGVQKDIGFSCTPRGRGDHSHEQWKKGTTEGRFPRPGGGAGCGSRTGMREDGNLQTLICESHCQGQKITSPGAWPGRVHLPRGFAGCEIKSASHLQWHPGLGESPARPLAFLQPFTTPRDPRGLYRCQAGMTLPSAVTRWDPGAFPACRKGGLPPWSRWWGWSLHPSRRFLGKSSSFQRASTWEAWHPPSLSLVPRSLGISATPRRWEHLDGMGGKSHFQPQPWPSLVLGQGRLEVVAFPCKNTSVLPALTYTSTRRSTVEHPLPWLFPCRLLGQKTNPICSLKPKSWPSCSGEASG